MGNNLIHLRAQQYYQENLNNLELARKETFLKIYSREMNIEKPDYNQILKMYTPQQQIDYINNHKMTKELRKYLKTVFLLGYNIPALQKCVNEKLKSKTLFNTDRENMESINLFGIKVFHIVKKYINHVLPDELKFLEDEPLFYYFVNQLYLPLTKDKIIYTVFEFFTDCDLDEKQITNLLNIKMDKNLKEQINYVKKLKEEHFQDVLKYLEIFEKNERSKNESGIGSILIFLSMIILVVLCLVKYFEFI